MLFAMDSHHSFIIPWILKRRVPVREGFELMFVNSRQFRRHSMDLTRGTKSGKQLTCILSTESKRSFIAIVSFSSGQYHDVKLQCNVAHWIKIVLSFHTPETPGGGVWGGGKRLNKKVEVQ